MIFGARPCCQGWAASRERCRCADLRAMSLAEILLIVAAAYFAGVAVILTLALSVLVAWDRLRPEEGLKPDSVVAPSPPG